MKKLFLILVLYLVWGGTVFSEEYYIRCVPKVMTIGEGDQSGLEKGQFISHRIMYAKISSKIDLRESDQPKRILSQLKLYTIEDNGKKTKKNEIFNIVSDKYWTEKGDYKSFDFQDNYTSKTLQALSNTNINYDGGSWVGSGNIIYNQVIKEKLEKTNWSWFGKCIEVDETHFKKPISNEEFEKNFDLNSW